MPYTNCLHPEHGEHFASGRVPPCWPRCPECNCPFDTDARCAQDCCHGSLPDNRDPVDFILAFESGILDDDEVIAGFQHLIDTGICWSLQGSYGRTAHSLIEQGLCHT